MNQTLTSSACALLVLALSCGLALAQPSGSAPGSGSSGAPGSAPGSGSSSAPSMAPGPASGTGSSVTGGGAAPAVQGGAGTRNSPTAKGEKIARGDRNFIVKAAESGMFEVQVSQLAASKATDPAVKSFAGMLVEHHSAANNELVQLANGKGVELPAAPPRGMRRDIDKLGKLSGAQFDQRYVREVGIKDHEKDIKLFQKGSKDVKDGQLKAWIDKTLPTLQQHLAQAQKLPQAGKSAAAETGRMGNTAGGTATGTPSGGGKTGN